MNISRKWLSRHVDISDKSAQEILLDLTMSTAEVEGVTQFGGGLEDVVIGHVLERVKHPDADKLGVCQVNFGGEDTQQIVCGAPNARDGLKVAVVRPGARLPGGLKIKKSKIRGVESLGMICSESELALSDSHDGILELPEDAPVGQRFIDTYDIVDDVWEIDNKSINHRPDLWGHRGIARELAAIYGRELKPLGKPFTFPEDGVSRPVRIDDLEACARYCGLVIDGVEATQSPEWLKRLLAAVGQRSIDLLVDLTNFVQLDLGQPMHAFDLEHVSESGIVVRRAKAGETMSTLDEVERELTAEDLVIASGDNGDTPVALAGVMGGLGSMVTSETRSLFLESANFHASTIRRTSTRTGLRTDSSARFEKTLDPAMAEEAVHHFLHLLREQQPGAKAAGPLVDPSAWSFGGRTVTLRRSRLDLKLGVSLEDERVTSILLALEFRVSRHGDDFVVEVPSFRATKDIAIEDDLIEEIGRMYRYDNIPEEPLVQAVSVPPRELELDIARQAIRLCATEFGAHEVYNYSFVPDQILEKVGAKGERYLRVSNPVAPDIAAMRRHVTPSLLALLEQNLRTLDEVRLVEDGRGVHPEVRDEHELPKELREIAYVWARRADHAGGHPYGALRETFAQLGRRLGYPLEMHSLLDEAPSWCHPGKTVAIQRGETVVGHVGHLHPRVARAMDLPMTTAVAVLELRALLTTEPAEERYQKISEYPSQPVDVALLVPKETRVADVETFLRGVGKKLVRDVGLFEVYTGEGIAVTHKSLNFTVTLGAMDRTLSNKDEEKFLSKVRERCAEIGGELRG